MAITENALCPVLIGRNDEVTLLEDALLQSFRGDGQVVALAGDAGVGKTRLATETADRARKIGGTVLWGGCSEADLALPYLPFVEAFGNWLASEDVASVGARLGPSAQELAQIFPQLGSSHPDANADPSQAKLRLFEAILSLLRVAAGETGALFIIEDLHWADTATRELIDYMTRRLRGVRVLVLATYRVDEMHRKHPLLPVVQGWRRSRLAQIIELQPLPPADVALMIAAIFDYENVSPEFRDFFHDRTEGNPFVLEEMLKEAIDRGDIYRTPERWERKDIGEIGLPRSVADSILLRVERLDADYAEVLRTASVLGPGFAYTTLLELAGLPESIVQSALHAAVLQQLLVEEGVGRYRFRHALTREAVYEDLIAPKRLELHGRAAEVLRALPATPAVDLARHLLAAQRWAEAVPVCLAAARDAMANRAFDEAADLAERALAHIDDRLERGRVLAFIGEAASSGANIAKASGSLERALEILEQKGDDAERANVHLMLGRVRWIQTRPHEASRHYEAARELLEPQGPSHLLAFAYVRLSGMAQFDFRFEEAVSLAKRAIEVAEAAGDNRSRVWAYLFLGGSLPHAPLEGIEWMMRGVEEAISRGFFDVAGNAIHNTAVILAQYGFLDRSDQMLARFDEISPHPFTTYSRSFVPSVNLVVRGRAAEALASLTAIERFASENGWPVWQGWVRQWIASAYTYRDMLDEAKPYLRDLDRKEELQEVSQTIHSTMMYAIAAGDQELARAAADRALTDGNYLFLGAIALFTSVALYAEGRSDELRSVLEKANISEEIPDYGATLGVRGMLAAASGNDTDAVELLRQCAERYDAFDCKVWAWEARKIMAEILLANGGSEAGREQLDILVREAHERGSPLIVRLAREIGSKHGLTLDTPTADAEPERQDAPTVTSERIVTVMFADVRGYTAMTRERAPSDMHDRMTTFYRWARSEIEKHEGMVDRYAGDAVMASWNSAVSSLNHTTLAVDTAIVLQDKASLMDLPVGVGIAVGAAFVGTMTGSDNVDVIGETTNLAARLQAQAAPGELLLDREAFRRAKQWIEDRKYRVEERTLELKGYDEAVVAFALTRS